MNIKRRNTFEGHHHHLGANEPRDLPVIFPVYRALEGIKEGNIQLVGTLGAIGQLAIADFATECLHCGQQGLMLLRIE